MYVDTVGDADKYSAKLSERFPSIKFVVAKKADSLYPVVSGASIVAKVITNSHLCSLLSLPYIFLTGVSIGPLGYQRPSFTQLGF